ncbi:MAG: ribonuclease III, partial [Actinobacteria bacterium]|nr:ribonuclease III [Actinomycetota bacterium]
MPEPDVTLAQCQDIIDYHFRDLELLSVSLQHSSASEQRLDSNERLEFLGDAVLDIIICEDLYRRFPHYSEGELTILKSAVV